MKSKLARICLAVSVAAFVAWWTGCSSDGSTEANGNDGGPVGPGAEAGGPGEHEGGTTTKEAGTPDAAKDAPVDSASPLGPFVDIPYGAASCPAFTPCGGDPKGSWKVTGGCVTEAVLAEAKAKCAGLVESDVKFRARGTVVTDAVKVTRDTEVEYTAKLAIPPECKPTQAPLNTCAAVGSGLVFYAGLDTATCTDDAATGGCNCDVADSFSDASSDTYTTSTSTLTTGSGNTERTFDYCVNGAGTELAYQETTAQAIPALFVLTK